jgi:hypothetical protein
MLWRAAHRKSGGTKLGERQDNNGRRCSAGRKLYIFHNYFKPTGIEDRKERRLVLLPTDIDGGFSTGNVS